LRDPLEEPYRVVTSVTCLTVVAETLTRTLVIGRLRAMAASMPRPDAAVWDTPRVVSRFVS
jgi:hypothetical protein